MKIALSLTGKQHAELKMHLFPGDGREAVAIAICGRQQGKDAHRLLVMRIVPIPHAACNRMEDQITWPTDLLVPLLQEASQRGLAIVKIHSHPGGYAAFSDIDDVSDRTLFPSVYGWMKTDAPHASCIMLPDGRIFGRAVSPTGQFTSLSVIKCVGDDLSFWRSMPAAAAIPEFARRIAQTFGAATYMTLQQLKIAVIGCSGTGSLVVEQLARNGVGALVLVDPDVVEEKNLNRIPNATMEDALNKTPKVDVFRRAVAVMGLGTQVETYQKDLFHADVVRAVADCDIVFGCMDSVDGRHLLNKLAVFYLLPYFDVGVKLIADGQGGVDQVCGSVNYLQPDGSSLLSRHVYNMEQVRAAGLYRTDPEAYAEQRKQGYIAGVNEDRPAVISVNMLYASLAVNELLARLLPYRLDPNAHFAQYTISLSHGLYLLEQDGEPCAVLGKHLGRGDMRPLLNSTDIFEEKRA